ncbi:DUF2799 domain-containing protein [Methylomonas sp. EFPC3]|uniref:DUF2799 domain-containing protein n=1 Tax=Methylomonas sp. EFPC3 TaxID=3021710 RepID=UPI0024171751|nr:DUF2799 domain-containing protein [Methylomonas sp. EFPC3]WFP50191.1 DUF2799 domain-containing protein [Methylomonas sp. EFPC3]
MKPPLKLIRRRFRRSVYLAAALLGLLFDSGCASLSREDCLRGDWFGVGIRDGLGGEPGARLADHADACREHGIVVDQAAYFAGRDQGLRDYCRLDNAFTEGLNGRGYQHVCPPAIDSQFARYNAAAYAVYEDRNELDQLQSDLSDKESRLRDSKLTDKERDRLRSELRDLDRHYDHHRQDLYFHERQLDDMRRELSGYR